MLSPLSMTWYQAANMASWPDSAIHYAIKKWYLAMLKVARRCQTQNEKSPHLRGLRRDLMPLIASDYQTRDHSHSMVAGGLLETS